MKPTPLEITRTNAADVRIRWSDGHDAVYPAAYLRSRCCCAVCSAVPNLAVDPAVQPVEIETVGGYALRFWWSDGHAAGLYAFPYLRGICPCPACGKRSQKPDGETRARGPGAK